LILVFAFFLHFTRLHWDAAQPCRLAAREMFVDEPLSFGEIIARLRVLETSLAGHKFRRCWDG
jgi:hypothetical protein